MSELALRVIDDVRALEALAPEWNALAQRSGASVFQTCEWTALWWEHLGARPGRALRVLVLRDDDGELVGAAALVLATDTLLGLPACRRVFLAGSGSAFGASSGLFLDDGPADYLDVLASPGAERPVAERIARYLVSESEPIDLAEFLNLPPGSFCAGALRAALESAGARCSQSDADACPRVTLSGDVPAFLKGRDSGVRRRLQQAVAAASEGTLFTLRRAESEAEVLGALDALIRLHQRRWRRLGYPGLFADRRFRAFQEGVARAFLRNGWLRVTRADAGASCAAVRLSFAFNGRLYDYLSGFDDASPAAKRRPGLAILLRQMEEAHREGIRTIDLLRGDEAYKFDLTAEAPRNVNLVATLPRPFGGALLRRASARSAFARFLAAREARLFGVALREHVFPASLYHYARFRAGRFVNKFIRAAEAPTATPRNHPGTA